MGRAIVRPAPAGTDRDQDLLYYRIRHQFEGRLTYLVNVSPAIELIM